MVSRVLLECGPLTEPKMKVIQTIEEMRQTSENIRSRGLGLGLVPTMGYFHEGHLSLMRRARAECDVVVTSIYVNPTQFGVLEDFERYPRDLPRDLEMAESVGVDYVFAPSDGEMYPEGFATSIRVANLSAPLCGWARPGHFEGVATVVAKLFNIIAPTVAYFGAKDYQQTVVIRRMVADLNLPVRIVVCPTVRESDGLAMSSRNTYLSPEERKQAPRIYQALREAAQMWRSGCSDAAVLRGHIRDLLQAPPAFQIDYVEIVHPESLLPLKTVGQEGGVAAVAVFLGRTRLIDNILLKPGADGV
jgi:pantoate--beta-alanine ligase